MSNKYWGEYDSSIIFCEDKYVESEYIAEYWNTISGLSYILVGMYFTRTMVRNIGLSLVFMGVGTMVLHGTLRWYGQWMDEMGMLTLMFFYIKGIYYDLSYKVLYIILSTYVMYNENHTIFLLMFITLLIYQYNGVNQIIISSRGRGYKRSYFASMCLGGICWILDRLCITKKYNFHMYWHILTAAGALFGTLYYYEHNMMLQDRGRKIKDWYLKIKKCK